MRTAITMLTLSNIGLDYATGGLPVLSGINLSLAKGEFVAIIGRSGSGKTSLLNIAAGFVQPTSGIASIDGRPITGPGRDRAVVFQDDALYPWLDARENVAFPLKLRGISHKVRAAAADTLLDLVGLPDAGHRKIWELSGGMRQRIGIARALASEPQFLLLDEPLGALDALTRTNMQSFLLDMWSRTGTGAMLITHSIDEALSLATRVVVLAPSPGRIIADIPVDFGRRHLAGTPLAALQSENAFKAAHARLTALIQQPAAEFAA
ncbi:taurine ABC transporter ATP-binding protein [Rhizobium alvei]